MDPSRKILLKMEEASTPPVSVSLRIGPRPISETIRDAWLQGLLALLLIGFGGLHQFGHVVKLLTVFLQF
jgi:hypothetical protein